MSDQKHIESKLKRSYGMDKGQRETIAKQNAKLDDWFGFCRKCGAKIEGTIEQIKAHTCE